jgi:hypothetical protein
MEAWEIRERKRTGKNNHGLRVTWSCSGWAYWQGRAVETYCVAEAVATPGVVWDAGARNSASRNETRGVLLSRFRGNVLSSKHPASQNYLHIRTFKCTYKNNDLTVEAGRHSHYIRGWVNVTPSLQRSESRWCNLSLFTGLLGFLDFSNRTMEKSKKPSNPVCYTPSSEPFRIYLPLFSFSWSIHSGITCKSGVERMALPKLMVSKF